MSASLNERTPKSVHALISARQNYENGFAYTILNFLIGESKNRNEITGLELGGVELTLHNCLKL